MNDDELEEQGFLKKILAAKKGTDKAALTSKPVEGSVEVDGTDIDALIKRIGVQNDITPRSVSQLSVPSGQAGAGPEIPVEIKPSNLPPTPPTEPPLSATPSITT
ncbi:MAG: hypothetical protein NTV68_07400, partial [Methanomicrobiales archaeon]|nr:hypothetical protein [Methanomicrobiales archaeon]